MPQHITVQLDQLITIREIFDFVKENFKIQGNIELWTCMSKARNYYFTNLNEQLGGAVKQDTLVINTAPNAKLLLQKINTSASFEYCNFHKNCKIELICRSTHNCRKMLCQECLKENEQGCEILDINNFGELVKSKAEKLKQSYQQNKSIFQSIKSLSEKLRQMVKQFENYFAETLRQVQGQFNDIESILTEMININIKRSQNIQFYIDFMNTNQVNISILDYNKNQRIIDNKINLLKYFLEKMEEQVIFEASQVPYEYTKHPLEQPINPVPNRVQSQEKNLTISFNIQDGNVKKTFQSVFSETASLNDLANTVQNYCNVSQNVATIDLYINNQPYNSEAKRKKSLFQLQIKDQFSIDAKVRWYG